MADARYPRSHTTYGARLQRDRTGYQRSASTTNGKGSQLRPKSAPRLQKEPTGASASPSPQSSRAVTGAGTTPPPAFSPASGGTGGNHNPRPSSPGASSSPRASVSATPTSVAQPSAVPLSATVPQSAPSAGSTTASRSAPSQLSRGDRVRGPRGGVGTVVGPAGSYALRAIGVTVHWDNGRETEERGSNLQLVEDRYPPVSPIEAWNTPASRSQADLGLGAARDLRYPLTPPSISNGSRTPKRRSALGASDNGQGTNPVDYLQEYSLSAGSRQSTTGEERARTPRPQRSSHLQFAERDQTVIIFDWDDTLFPTTYVLWQLQLNPDLPLAKQPKLVGRNRDVVTQKVALCEDKALELLRRGCCCGNVVIVTLAAQTWLGKSCQNFYPRMGKLVRSMQIKIVCAQNQTRIRKARAKAKTDEQFWGLVKGLAISEEIEQIYSQYEGQTWKNVLSIGDSNFERYGLLAASTAYMQGRRLSVWDPGSSQVRLLHPTQKTAWQRVDEHEHLVRLRVKCCKLVGQPDIDELIIQLDTLSRWVHLMAQCDVGFDLNLEYIEGETQVALVESVLRGERPTKPLPKALSVMF
eukprot:TRINITY_DN27157_c0_g1_i1.p1 TRINITY_DN27157_c0_g1~~TRINITY_DN27157_c0_g1_i1.p1  ORF type:complete len:583 (+),score=69.59 TRINITY_DN27157_c0_g1_i1:109-1857(+)